MYMANDVVDALSRYAPFSLSEEYKTKYSAYDNSGLLFDSGEKTAGVVCALDLTDGVLDKAEELGYKAVVTHHPVIFSPVKKLSVFDRLTPNSSLVRAAKSGISVISAHLNADCAEEGVDYSLMRAVRLSSGLTDGGREEKLFEPLSVPNTGYGRFYKIGGVALFALAERLKGVLGAKRVFVYGDGDKILSSAASFCGAGLSEEALSFAYENGADVIITSEIKHHILTAAVHAGVCIVELTHYGSESYGFERLCRSAFSGSGIKAFYLADEEML